MLVAHSRIMRLERGIIDEDEIARQTAESEAKARLNRSRKGR